MRRRVCQVSDAVALPMDVVKQRLQLPNSPYRGVWDCIVRVSREEGMGAFFRSYQTTLVMNVRLSPSPPPPSQGVVNQRACHVSSSTTDSSPRETNHGLSHSGTVRPSPCLEPGERAVQVPYTMIHFAVYEGAKQALGNHEDLEERLLTHIAAGGAAGGIAAVSVLGDAKSSRGDAKSSVREAKSSLGDAKSSLGDAKSSVREAKSSLGDVQAVTTPLDVVKTRLQTDCALRSKELVHALPALPRMCDAMARW
jgi:hypothetical protein